MGTLTNYKDKTAGKLKQMQGSIKQQEGGIAGAKGGLRRMEGKVEEIVADAKIAIEKKKQTNEMSDQV